MKNSKVQASVFVIVSALAFCFWYGLAHFKADQVLLAGDSDTQTIRAAADVALVESSNSVVLNQAINPDTIVGNPLQVTDLIDEVGSQDEDELSGSYDVGVELFINSLFELNQQKDADSRFIVVTNRYGEVGFYDPESDTTMSAIPPGSSQDPVSIAVIEKSNDLPDVDTYKFIDSIMGPATENFQVQSNVSDFEVRTILNEFGEVVFYDPKFDITFSERPPGVVE